MEQLLSKCMLSDQDGQPLAGSPCPPLANWNGQTSQCSLSLAYLPLVLPAPLIHCQPSSCHSITHYIYAYKLTAILAQYLPATGTPHCRTLMK
jgi:hypothetical protein